MHCRVFGKLVDVVGGAAIELDVVPVTVADMRSALLRRFPGLEDHLFAIALDDTIATDADRIPQGASVALLPPFSGG